MVSNRYKKGHPTRRYIGQLVTHTSSSIEASPEMQQDRPCSACEWASFIGTLKLSEPLPLRGATGVSAQPRIPPGHHRARQPHLDAAPLSIHGALQGDGGKGAARRLDVLHARELRGDGAAVAAVLLGPPGGHLAAGEDGGEGEAVAVDLPHAAQLRGRGRGAVVFVAPGDHAAAAERGPGARRGGHLVHVGERATFRVAPRDEQAVVAQRREARLVGEDLLHLRRHGGHQIYPHEIKPCGNRVGNP